MLRCSEIWAVGYTKLGERASLYGLEPLKKHLSFDQSRLVRENMNVFERTTKMDRETGKSNTHWNGEKARYLMDKKTMVSV